MDETTAARSLLTPAAVRERAHEMLQLGVDGKFDHWRVDLDRLPSVAAYVAAVVRGQYPDLDVPFHARWRHFMLGKADLWSLARSEEHTSELQSH